jgi:thiosulfate/3-mercaptopyruvate sulfurtransferase
VTEPQTMVVGTEWLAGHLGDPDLVVVDMRWREDGSGRSLYDLGHIPGAVFLDWSSDIVDPDHDVAFMLASREQFAEAMERAGIGDQDVVVAYADRLGSGPFRLWWACRRYGHDQVRILDGGLEVWTTEGRPVSGEPTPRRLSEWRPHPSAGAELVATAHDVHRAEQDSTRAVLDSRDPVQFHGWTVWFESGPVAAGPDGIARTPRGDIRAGRVPWALNVPFYELYRPDHTLRSPEELRELFARVGVPPSARCVTYCGVAISASALAFALVRAGFEDVKLYDGSWEEWGRDPSRPVARG